jgi:CBS domain-containing protein
MLLRDILRVKGSDVFWTLPTARLSEMVRVLVEHNCGSLVVLADGESRKLVGIITERDILRVTAAGKPLDQTLVQEAMTREVITGHIDDSVDQAMDLMTERRIRHLPLVEAEELVGIISIGDVVKAHRDLLTAENHHLKSYIQS